MVVVLNAKGTSVSSFQIGKQGPQVKNSSGTIQIRDSSDASFAPFQPGVMTLQGDIDANSFDIQFDDATGIRDDSDNEQLIFQKTASAVNYFEITNAATGSDPIVAAVGDDTNINIQLTPKGTGNVIVGDGAGGNSTINTGAGDALTISTGATTGATDVGDITISAGDAAGSGAGGGIILTPGTSGSGTAGQVCVTDENSANVTCFDGVASAVNYIEITNAVTGSDPIVAAVGSDTNIDITLTPKGTGEVIIGDGAGGDSTISTDAGDALTISTGATTGATDVGDIIISAGDAGDSGAGGNITLTPGTSGSGTAGQVCVTDENGANVTCFDGVASAVNYIEITNAAAGTGPAITVAGSDTNADLSITPKGTGNLILDNLVWPNTDGTSSQVLTTDGSGNLSFGDYLQKTNDLSDVNSASTSRTNLGVAIGQSLDVAGAWSAWTNKDIGAGTPTDVDLLTGLTGIEEIYMIIEDLSSNSSTQAMMLQLGTGAGPTYVATGYGGSVWGCNASANNSETNDTGLSVTHGSNAGDEHSGFQHLVHVGSNKWLLQGTMFTDSTGAFAVTGYGTVTLGAELTAIRIISEGGTATFDGGQLWIRTR